MEAVAEEELHGLYQWVDEIPLSRRKRNIARDFSDGVLVAEIVAHFHPRLVELHNYSGAHSTQQKLYNWHTLNQKVFKHLGCSVQKLDCERIVNAEPGVIEQVLKMLRARLQLRLEAQYSAPEEPPRSVEPPMRTRVLQSAPAQQQRATPARQHPLPAEASLALSDVLVAELRDTNQILETKVEKLERLVRLKDAKIAALLHKLNIGEAGAAE